MANRSSPAYSFTTYDETDSRIAELKKQARVTNAFRRAEELAGTRKVKTYTLYTSGTVCGYTRQRVVVRGRLGKNNVYASLYRKGGELHRYSAQTIKNEHASRFDVYLQEVTVWRKA